MKNLQQFWHDANEEVKDLTKYKLTNNCHNKVKNAYHVLALASFWGIVFRNERIAIGLRFYRITLSHIYIASNIYIYILGENTYDMKFSFATFICEQRMH